MTTETIEGEALDVTPSAVVRAEPRSVAPVVGIFELGEMDDAQYQRQVAVITKGLERIKSLMRDLLVRDRDYLDFANLGNTGDRKRDERVGLLKSGSEALASYFHLVPEFRATVHVETFPETYPAPPKPDRIDVDVTVLVHYGSLEGPVVGSGSGSATSWETKYHWRNDSRKCPDCGVAGFLFKSKPPKHGWYCWSKPEAGKMGCGAQYGDDNDPRIMGQEVGRVENPEPHELRNTLVKMASKRAWTDGVIRALNASSLFTQDMEDRQDRAETAQERPATPRTVSGPPDGMAHVDSADAPADFRGKVLEAPLGIHRDASGRPALKFTMKVGNAKHHAIVVGPLAETVIAMDLKAEEPIVVTGVLVLDLVPWGDGTKPPMKHIEDVVRVVVKRDDAWVIKEAGASADPTPSTQAVEPALPTSSDGDDPGPVLFPDKQQARDMLVRTEATLLELAAADTVAVKGTPGERISAFGVIASQAWVDRPGKGRMVVARVLADGYVYQCAAPESVGRTQMLADGATRDDQWRYAIGDRVRIIGTWAAGDIAVLTGIVRAPE